MIKRTHKWYIKELLDEKKNEWNILDLGCGAKSPWNQAQTYLDMNDYTKSYPGKRFVQGDAQETPFEDKEFDFVIASQIAEHAADPKKFIQELMRIGKRGYIEIPTHFCDNIVIGNDAHHPWWVTFDDVLQHIIYIPKVRVLNELLWFREYNMMLPFFRDSLVIELYWEDSIEWVFGNQEFEVMGRKVDLKEQRIKPWSFGEISRHDVKKMMNKTKQ